MTLQSASERGRDCARRKAQRVRDCKIKVQEFLALISRLPRPRK
jgi:hypothetical protein